MKKHTLTALILASSVLSAAAYADCDKGHKKSGDKKRGAKHFSMIDSNDDGKLSKEEMLNFHEGHFTKMDSDGDGFISKEEMKAKEKHKGKKKHLMKMDTNKDGEISDEEKAAYKMERKEKKERANGSED
jgi:Ca2+-binding EF-hand superfamily protein